MNLTIKFRNNNKEIFSILKEEWLVATPKEVVRQNFICTLVNYYGYNLQQIEYGKSAQNLTQEESKLRADILIWKSTEEKTENKLPFITVACQASDISNNEAYQEVENYALIAGAKFFATYYEINNKKELRIYKFLDEKPPLQKVELEDFPNANILNDDIEIEGLLRKVKYVSKEEFKKIFFACHDAIRNNDKLSPEMAFDEISKVLFIKIRFEKENKRIFDRNAFLSLEKAYQDLFNDVKEKHKEDEIFEEKDTLRIRELTFLQILDKLGTHNLAEVSEDVKGVAFEEFLGKTFRGDLGQFFTPRTLVDFMVNVLDPKEGELVADPCCGSGGFLIKTFDYVKENIKNEVRAEKDVLRKKYKNSNFAQLSEIEQNKINSELIGAYKELDKVLDNTVKGSRLHNLSYNCIYGTDAEPRSARTAKMNMIMQGDGHSGVHHNDGLLNINGMFENRFDVILTNPPFGARVSRDLIIKANDVLLTDGQSEKYKNKYGQSYIDAQNATLKKLDEKQKELQVKSKDQSQAIDVPLLSMFDTGEYSTLTEVLFMERCLNLLRKGGRMGVVLPEGFLNGSDLQRVREYIESRAKLLLIVSVPQDVFISAGASVKSSLVFLKRFTEEEEKQYAKIKQTVKKEIEQKYEQEILEKERAHKQIWHQMQAKRAYIRDVKSIKTSKSEKNMQILFTNSEIAELQEQHKIAKKEFDAWKKDLDTKKEAEIKAEIKQRFDYEIPIVQVEKAGISSVGTQIENDLMWQKGEERDENTIKILDEFRAYFAHNPLWQSNNINF